MLRDEILVAERLGVSPRRLWGEEPSVELVRTDRGFLVIREPEFTPDDVRLFRAARDAVDALSPRGIPWSDEMDPKARFRVGDDEGLPFINYAERAQARAVRAYEKQYPDAETDGLRWPVTLLE